MTRKIYLLILLFPLLMGAAFQYGGIRYDITSITTSTTPVVLTTSSLQVQRFTGSSAQTVTLPDATDFAKSGFRYTIINESSGAISVNNDAGVLVRQVAAASQGAPTSATFYVASVSTNGGPWTVDSGLGSGGGGGAPQSQVVVSDSGATVGGSTDGYVRRFGTVNINTGTDITHATSAANADTFTINAGGLYSVTYSDYINTGNSQYVITVNSATLNAAVGSLAWASGFRGSCYAGAGLSCQVASTLRLSAGDVVRAQFGNANGAGASGVTSAQLTYFMITKIGD